MLPLRVAGKTRIATDVYLFELAPPDDDTALPSFDAGSHVTVLTPASLTRRYSLCNAPRDRNRWRIAVKREAEGGGGSVSLIDAVQVGDVLPTSPPSNYFPLDPQARSHLLIAGGIGITPMMSMVRELQARGADFRVVYLTRTPESAAFRDELTATDLRERVLMHHDHGDATRNLDLAALLATPRDGEHVYCCGPRGLMQSVRELTSHWPAGRVHFEDFGTSEQPKAGEDQPFKVRLARSGQTLEVPTGVSILEVLRRAGVPAPSSCESGTCGACRTPLVAGCADHRDYVLDEDEHDKAIMICVSRARGTQIDIDL